MRLRHRFIAPLLLVALVCVGAPSIKAKAQEAPSKPNLLVIMTDDQRIDTMNVMPITSAAFDVDFSNFVVTTPSCCPSRSSFLTGQYVHNTGVYGTSPAFYQKFKRLEPDSLGPWLQAQGYHTGLIGKYFNYVMRDDPVPPGWDEFFGRLYGKDIGNATTEFTLHERFGEHDEIVAYPNPQFPDAYATRVFATKAQQFLERAPQDKPFALLVWTTAPNTMGPEPAYADAPLPEWKKPPSFMERDLTDKPLEIRRSQEVESSPSFHRIARADQLRQLMTVDDMVETILGALDASGLRDDTWGVYTSDNGRFWGEHRLKSKVYAYEESARVPFRMMIPDYPARRFNQLAANIDLAPTLMELAGDTSAHDFNGRSLLPLIEGTSRSWRNGVLIEHLPTSRRYDALRTNKWLYVEWPGSGHRELYQLRLDPYQLRNVVRLHPRRARSFHRRVEYLAGR